MRTPAEALHQRIIRGVVFDLDGVLVDSEPLHFRATNRLLNRYGRTIELAEYASSIGMGEEETWTDWKERFGIPLPLEQIYAAIEVARQQEIATGVDPIVAAVDLAHDLSQRGMPLALASASTRGVIDALLAQLGLSDVFRVRVSGEDPEVRHSKPAPDIYLRATDLLGIEPAHCAAIEDSSPGIRAAKSAGLFGIAVPSPWTKQQDFSSADLIVESLRQLPELAR